jgi:hypothetical protein
MFPSGFLPSGGIIGDVNVVQVNGNEAAAAALATTTPIVTKCKTAGGTQSAPTLQETLPRSEPSDLGAAYECRYFDEIRDVLSYSATTLTVVVDSPFTMPVEGGNDISFWRKSGVTAQVGPGSDQCTMTINDGTDPIPDARVWISTDAAGTDVIAGALPTDDLGRVTFLLFAGTTYYLWMRKVGENPILGSQFIAVAD